MKERPIIFKDEMVRAILDGRKTQTRRVVKARGWSSEYLGERELVNVLHGEAASGLSCAQPVDSAWAGFNLSPNSASPSYFRCPYGQPGDRLWVKETTIRVEEHGYVGPEYVASENGQAMLDHGLAPGAGDAIEVEPYDLRLRPSIFMPRSMARILLEVTSVRVERLQDICAIDARAEGCLPPDLPPWPGAADDYVADERTSFAILWTRINGPGSWDANPWVWVVEFRRIEQESAAA